MAIFAAKPVFFMHMARLSKSEYPSSGKVGHRTGFSCRITVFPGFRTRFLPQDVWFLKIAFSILTDYQPSRGFLSLANPLHFRCRYARIQLAIHAQIREKQTC